MGQRRRLGVLMTAVLLIAGCGGGGEDPPAATDEPTAPTVDETEEANEVKETSAPAVTPPDATDVAAAVETTPDVSETEMPADPAETAGGELPQAVATYFTALATKNPTEMEAMLDVSADASPAKGYAGAQYGATFVEREQGGFTADPSLVEFPGDGSIELCDIYGEEPECFPFSEFLMEGEQLVSFSADGVSIDELASVPSPVESLGVTFTPLGAYESVQVGNLFMAVDVTASAEGERNLSFADVEYIDPDNRSRAARLDNYTGNPMRPGVTQTVLFTVEGTKTGGYFVFQLSDGSFGGGDVRVVMVKGGCNQPSHLDLCNGSAGPRNPGAGRRNITFHQLDHVDDRCMMRGHDRRLGVVISDGPQHRHALGYREGVIKPCHRPTNLPSCLLRSAVDRERPPQGVPVTGSQPDPRIRCNWVWVTTSSGCS